MRNGSKNPKVERGGGRIRLRTNIHLNVTNNKCVS